MLLITLIAVFTCACCDLQDMMPSRQSEWCHDVCLWLFIKLLVPDQIVNWALQLMGHHFSQRVVPELCDSQVVQIGHKNVLQFTSALSTAISAQRFFVSSLGTLHRIPAVWTVLTGMLGTSTKVFTMQLAHAKRQVYTAECQCWCPKPTVHGFDDEAKFMMCEEHVLNCESIPLHSRMNLRLAPWDKCWKCVQMSFVVFWDTGLIVGH